MDNEVRKKINSLLNEGYSRQEIADELGVSRSRLGNMFRENGIVLTDAQKKANHVRAARKGWLTTPNRNNPMDNPEYRRRVGEGLRKSHKTKEGREKAKKTMLERYGFENPFKSKEVQAKIRKTNLKKYGFISPMQNENIRRRGLKNLKKTLQNKSNLAERKRLLLEGAAQKGRKLFPAEIEKLWGLSNSNTHINIHKMELEEYVSYKESRLESSIEQFLLDNQIFYIKHARNIITPQEIDFYIPEFNLGIEANDWHSHNSSFSTFGGKPVDKKYHYNKSVSCREKGIRLIHVWDYEWNDTRQRPILESIILGACNKAKTVYARKCSIEVRRSAAMKDFFNQNNIQGFRGGKFAICLVYEGEVVMAYMMGHPFFGKGKYEWEVIRGATKLGYRVIGGASRIWKHFIQDYNPSSIVYYVDFNYFSGNSVEVLGAKFVQAQPSFKNYFIREGVIRNRQPMKHQEIKQSIAEHKACEIWNAGTLVYVWEKSDKTGV